MSADRDEPENLLTAGQVAERLGMTIRMVRYWDQTGKLKATCRSPSGHRMYRREDIERAQMKWQKYLAAEVFAPNAEERANDPNIIRAHVYSILIEAKARRQYQQALLAAKILLDTMEQAQAAGPALPPWEGAPADEREVIEATVIEARKAGVTKASPDRIDGDDDEP